MGRFKLPDENGDWKELVILNEQGKVPDEQLPPISGVSWGSITGDVTAQSDIVNYIKQREVTEEGSRVFHHDHSPFVFQITKLVGNAYPWNDGKETMCVGVGSGNKAVRFDLLTGEKRQFFVSSNFNVTNGLCYGQVNGQDVFVAVSQTADGFSGISYNNGQTWTQIQMPTAGGYNTWAAVIHVPMGLGTSKFIAFNSNNDYIAISEDGVNWTAQSTGTGVPGFIDALYYMFGNVHICAIAYTSGNGVRAVTMDGWDVDSWSSSTFTNTSLYGGGKRVIQFAGTFFIYGNTSSGPAAVACALDAGTLTWSEVSLESWYTTSGFQVCGVYTPAAKNEIIALGYDGTKMCIAVCNNGTGAVYVPILELSESLSYLTGGGVFGFTTDLYGSDGVFAYTSGNGTLYLPSSSERLELKKGNTKMQLNNFLPVKGVANHVIEWETAEYPPDENYPYSLKITDPAITPDKNVIAIFSPSTLSLDNDKLAPFTWSEYGYFYIYSKSVLDHSIELTYIIV